MIPYSSPLRWLFRAMCGCLLCTILGSCIASKAKVVEEKPKKKEIQPPKLVGRIASIPADQRFVLIQSYGKWEIPTGSTLTTQGAGEKTANLLATGESLGQYAAADLQAGQVEVGDAVYFRPVIKTPETTETATVHQPPEAQKLASPESSQQENVPKNN